MKISVLETINWPGAGLTPQTRKKTGDDRFGFDESVGSARAATVVSSRIVGDGNQYQILQQKEAFARASAMEYECNQGDYTYFGHSGNTNRYTSYKPYNALYR